MNTNGNYELIKFERLIRSGAHSLIMEVGHEENYLSLEEIIKGEAERIKQAWIHKVFNIGDERCLERYIQYHQQAIIRLMDESIGLRKMSKSEVKALYDYCYAELDQLLSFVEQHFTKYFDQDAKAPEGYLVVVKKNILENLKNIEYALLSKSADSELIEVILYALRNIVERDMTQAIRYRKVIYAKELQKELLALINNEPEATDINDGLRSIMYYLNYNAANVFNYHTRYIDCVLKASETQADKIEKLSYILKKINQVQGKQGISYQVNAPSLKSQLNGFIMEEIEHLQRIQQVNFSVPIPPSESTFFQPKIHLDLSVAQVAFLIKIFIEANLIVNSNVTELLRFFSKILVSKRSENISYDSLRSKYYNVEQGTRESVNRALFNMINIVNRV